VSPVRHASHSADDADAQNILKAACRLVPQGQESKSLAQIRYWITERLNPSLNRRLLEIASSEDVVRVAVMPDVHEGASFPNGCVVATRTRIYPEAVGKDIGCGVSAIRCNGPASGASKKSLEEILRRLASSVPSLKHSCATAITDLPQACNPADLSDRRLQKIAMREGILQCGTLGRGNHFVELQRVTILNYKGS
jgi:tRNA-splicing ligase RtcB